MDALEIIENFPKDMNGRAMLGLPAAELLMELVAESEGEYIEIGAGFGGSAVMALAAGASLVYCIDPFVGVNSLEDRPDPLHRVFWKNMHHYGMENDVICFKQYSQPFPEAIHYHRFEVGLIDGHHFGSAPYKDFLELDNRVTEYLLFDNADRESVAKTVEAAIKGGNWELHKEVEYESSYEKKDGELVKFVALARIGQPSEGSLFDRMQYYGGTMLPTL